MLIIKKVNSDSLYGKFVKVSQIPPAEQDIFIFLEIDRCEYGK